MAHPSPPGILRAPGQPVFLNPAFMAPNVFEVDLPADLVSDLDRQAPAIRAMETKGATYPLEGGVSLYCERPASWRSDICWLSHADERSYRWFEAMFDRLALAAMVAEFVPHDREIRLFAGSFVTRSRCAAHDFHCDWLTRENHAFTLMAPITGNAGVLGMAYKDVRGTTRGYSYPAGKGIVFGTHFEHSTAVGELDQRAVYLCFNFGTDRMEHWPELAKTTGGQGDFYRLPDGRFEHRPAAQGARGG